MVYFFRILFFHPWAKFSVVVVVVCETKSNTQIGQNGKNDSLPVANVFFLFRLSFDRDDDDDTMNTANKQEKKLIENTKIHCEQLLVSLSRAVILNHCAAAFCVCHKILKLCRQILD